MFKDLYSYSYSKIYYTSGHRLAACLCGTQEICGEKNSTEEADFNDEICQEELVNSEEMLNTYIDDGNNGEGIKFDSNEVEECV